jgi:colicin import membrane protein
VAAVAPAPDTRLEAAKAAPVPRTAPASRPAPTPPPARIPANQVETVGFKQLPEASRVFIRTSDTPRFTISEAVEGVVRVEFPNTRVPLRNDLNRLDTSFFPTAVEMVTPSRVGNSYVLEIRLRERVAWSQRVDGDTLSIDFERPATLRPAAPAGRSPESPMPPAGPAGS